MKTEDLGVKDIKLFNEALLAKWKWKMATESNGLWKQVLESKYKNWISLKKECKMRHKSRWLRDLRKTFGSTDQMSWLIYDMKDWMWQKYTILS